MEQVKNNLFVCEHCCAIASDNGIKALEDLPNVNGYPNMRFIDMQGRSSQDTHIYNDGAEPVLYKKKEDIKMLCTKCNTGEWKERFEEKHISPNDKRLYLAIYSKYNFITPFDHPIGITKKASIRQEFSEDGTTLGSIKDKNEDGSDAYELVNDSYLLLYKTVNKYLSSLNNGYVSFGRELFTNKRLRVLLDVIREDNNNINILAINSDTIKKFFEATTLEAFNNALFTLLKDKTTPVSSDTYLGLITVEFFTLNTPVEIALKVLDEILSLLVRTNSTITNILSRKSKYAFMESIQSNKMLQEYLKPNSREMLDNNFGTKLKKNHWKNTQSQEDREAKLQKAVEKRERKKLKKSKVIGE